MGDIFVPQWLNIFEDFEPRVWETELEAGSPDNYRSETQ